MEEGEPGVGRVGADGQAKGKGPAAGGDEGDAKSRVGAGAYADGDSGEVAEGQRLGGKERKDDVKEDFAAAGRGREGGGDKNAVAVGKRGGDLGGGGVYGEPDQGVRRGRRRRGP